MRYPPPRRRTSKLHSSFSTRGAAVFRTVELLFPPFLSGYARPPFHKPDSDQRYFASAGAALAFPLVILAQLGLVLLHLGFHLEECLLATGAHCEALLGGAQRSCV